MRVGVVISTIGQSGALGLVLESIASQTHPAQQIIVVDQSDGMAVSDLVKRWSDLLPIARLTSARGVSLGRNTGWQALDECDIVAFSDDDCTYEPTAFAEVAREFEDLTVSALSGRLTGSGERLAFSGERCDIDRKSVWTKAIEATTFYRLGTLQATGGFDVTLGVGAPTKWQSGEGTDLLLRALELGGRAIYVPTIVVSEHQKMITHADYLRKVRAYGRGTGRVYRLRYTLPERVLVIVKPLIAVALHALRGRTAEARQKWQAALGRAEGMTQSP